MPYDEKRFASVAKTLLNHRRSEYRIRATVAAFKLVPAIAQVITKQVIEAIGQVTVLLVLNARLRVCHLVFALGAVVVLQLINEVFGELAAANVYQDFPTVVTVEYFVDEIAAGYLRGLFLQ